MPEVRCDAITGAAVVVAPERAARPRTFGATAALRTDTACPFCPGHEDRTPPEVARLGPGPPDAPGWRVRVVPNLFPIVGEASGSRPDDRRRPGSPSRSEEALGGGSEPATGAHEVVVYTPDHDRPIGALDDAEVADAFSMLRDRVGHHHRAGRTHAQAFVNHGPEAGASLAHPHAQLVALDLVGPTTAAELNRFATASSDLVVDDLLRATERGTVVADGAAPAWCPWAAGAPYETLVASPTSGPRFDESPDDEVLAVALAVRDVLGRLRAALGDAPHNLVVHTAPPSWDGPYHWYVRVTPRVTVRAGFEESTGVRVNVVPPESAAAALRDADPAPRRDADPAPRRAPGPPTEPS